jgi:tRNA pseudouridine55 synthase
MSSRTPSVHGVLLIDKPAGPTSHDIVQWVRWAIRERSVGHCGTLDPAATGLLVVCVGAVTKLVEYLSAADKAYEARFVLGIATDSADADGNETARAAVSREQAEAAPAVLAEMTGELMLPPPALSAIRVDGRRAHERARAGEDVRLDPRPMSVLAPPGVGEPRPGPEGTWILDATVEVSKGTYVRSLAVELGARMGVPAHLGALRRTRSGPAGLDHPGCVGDLQARPRPAPAERGWRIRPRGVDDRAGCRERLLDGLQAPGPLLPFATLEVPERLLERLSQGQRLSAHEPAFAGLVEGEGDHALAVAERAPDLMPDLMVVVRHEPGRDAEGRIAPEKVVRVPRAGSVQDPGA